MSKAAERQENAWAQGTHANYRSALRKYMAFCFTTGIVPSAPSYQQVCAYIEYMVHTTPSPRTVANNLSHVRTYFRKANIPTTQIDSWRVKWAMVAVTRDKDYIPRIKSAMPAQTLQRLVISLPNSEHGIIMRASVLLMYYAALRQSEVLPNSVASYDPRRHLSRQDVVLHSDFITITIKHAKNLQSVYEKKTVNLQSAPNSQVCVVEAIRNMYLLTPTASPSEPCIMFSVSRRPVTVEYVRRNWMKHLQNHGVDSAAFSLHSLRKAAATEAHNQGCNELDIQRYGGWKSNAHRAYISSSQNRVNQAVINALNQP